MIQHFNFNHYTQYIWLGFLILNMFRSCLINLSFRESLIHTVPRKDLVRVFRVSSTYIIGHCRTIWATDFFDGLVNLEF